MHSPTCIRSRLPSLNETITKRSYVKNQFLIWTGIVIVCARMPHAHMCFCACVRRVREGVSALRSYDWTHTLAFHDLLGFRVLRLRWVRRPRNHNLMSMAIGQYYMKRITCRLCGNCSLASIARVITVT